MTYIFLAIWITMDMVRVRCPFKQRKCADEHYETAVVEHQKFFFNKRKAKALCASVVGKNDCYVIALDEKALNARFGLDVRKK